MKKFELPEQPQKTNTSKEFTVAKEAIANLDKFDYAWKTYSHKIEKRFTAAIKYIEELEARLKECEDLRIGANNEAAKEYALKCELAEDRAELKREIEQLKSQLEKQQPEIPEVPQFVAELIKKRKGNWSLFGAFRNISGNKYDNEKLYEWVFAHAGRQEIFAQAWTNGYTVAKEKRYEVVFLEDDTTRQILMENNAGYYFIEEESENYGYWKQDFTEMEIKEINEKFWQLSVPVKDEQIEVQE